MSIAEEHNINYEIGAGFVLAFGMLSMMMHELTGTLVILAGTLALVLIYTRRVFAVRNGEGDIKYARHIIRINYTALTLSLVILGLLMLVEKSKPVLLYTGLSLLAGLTIFDLALFRKKYFCIQISQCLLRNILLALLLVLFYRFPLK